MKTFKLIGMSLVAVMMGTGFAACSEDDDNGGENNPPTENAEEIYTYLFFEGTGSDVAYSHGGYWDKAEGAIFLLGNEYEFDGLWCHYVYSKQLEDESQGLSPTMLSVPNPIYKIKESPWWTDIIIDANDIKISTIANHSTDARSGIIVIEASSWDGKYPSATKEIRVTQPSYTPSTPNTPDDDADEDNSTSMEPQWGKAEATVSVRTTKWDSYLSYVNGKTTKIDYVYYPNTGKYYAYGGIYDANSEANGGKGPRYDAHKGYNTIVVHRGMDRDYSITSYTAYYSWSISINFTIP